jgi:hypothetical protein
MTTTGLKNVNMLTKEQYDGVSVPATDELYAVSGSGFGFPSSNAEDLELGATGTTYTAPANGYVYVNKSSTASGQYVNIYDGLSSSYRSISSGSGQPLLVHATVRKGKKYRVEYTAAGATNTFKFIYAEGE